MIVIRPRRRQHQIAGMHRGPNAIHRRVTLLALDHEPDRGSRVAMRWRRFPWIHQLQARIHALGDQRRSLHGRILENQHAPFGFLRRDQLARFEQQRSHLLIAPQRGPCRRPRLLRNQIAQHLPQRSRMLLLQPLIILMPFSGRCRLGKKGQTTPSLPACSWPRVQVWEWTELSVPFFRTPPPRELSLPCCRSSRSSRRSRRPAQSGSRPPVSQC